MNDLIQQLKALKHSQAAGAVDNGAQGRARAELLQAIGGASTAPRTIDYFAYYKEVFTKTISIPVTVVASFFVLVFGGWMTTVNAASNSLPGDTLYTVKILTEQAQLRFASRDRRAVLHTEFAQRRLEEAVALTNDPMRTEDAEIAITAFHEELAAANTELQRLQEDGDKDALVAIANVDQVLEGLEAVIGDTKPETEEVLETAKDAARETSQVVETVAVETHEANPQEESQESVEELFRDRLAGIRDREAFNYGRLVVLSRAAEEAGIAGDELKTLNFLVESTAARVHDAMGLAAAGGYRAAFDILREVDTGLLEIESQIVELEALVIASQQPVDPIELVPEEEVVEEDLEAAKLKTDVTEDVSEE